MIYPKKSSITLPALTWGTSYSLATLLAGPGALLNPALTLATLLTRQVLSSRFVLQLEVTKQFF